MKGFRRERVAAAAMAWVLAMAVASCMPASVDVPAQEGPRVREAAAPAIPVAAVAPLHGSSQGSAGAMPPAAALQSDGFHFGDYIQHVRVEIRDEGNTQFPVIYESLASGDFNGDGRADIVALVSSMSVLDVYLQRGDGTFGEPITYRYVEHDSISPGDEILVGDFNGDGVDDVAFHLRGGETMLGSVGLLLSRPGNRPRLHVGYPELYEGSVENPFWAALDADGDGHLDLVLNRQHPDDPARAYLQVLHGDGAGNFVRPSWLRIAPSGWTGKILATDMDNDGTADLVVELLEPHPTQRKGRMVVVHSLPGGGLSSTPRELFEFVPSWDVPDFGDIDGNGWKDGVFGDLIYLQVAKEVFEGPYVLSMANGYPYTPLLADVDGDGRTDLINHQFGAYFTIPYLSVYLQRNGMLEETFRIQDPPWNHAFRVAESRHPYVAADFNTDGCVDVAIAVGYDGMAVLPAYDCIGQLQPPVMSRPLPPSRMP